MPKQPIYFDQPVLDRLKNYAKEKYGNRRILSAVVQRAVVKYLNEEDKSGKPKKKPTK